MADAQTIKKNPTDFLVYAMEFGFQPEIINGTETINVSIVPSWLIVNTVAGGDTLLTIGGTGFNGTQALGIAAGGTEGNTYIVTCTVTYVSGRVRSLTGQVQVTGK